VAEKDLMPWIKAEVERLRLVDPATGEPIDAVKLASDNAARREALAARLARANEMFVLGPRDGGWTRERRDAEAAKVAAELDALEATEAVVGATPIRPDEWETWSPPDLNAYIRAILERVELAPDLRPVRAVWRNQALRS
jgi:acyl-CoA reductase-like NAD-dependent aldehyde dehydrogenase